ncbi:MAG: 4-hydroxy-3-methylbut-2-enyl diphosphate reductase [Candidatus Omnitrophota bacterium]|nr:MAG: 4-hydroxy-3-methylbut-2-enyl diphosphate reductase [Candidatus Omnitrophota bacterium]
MRINIAKSAGFCSGVKRAISIAFETARNKKSVCMLGDIVHNEDVTRNIQRIGVQKISKLGKGRDKILLIRAHGAPQKIIFEAIKSGYEIADATCPMVKEIHKIAKEKEKEGCDIIVIGDKNHEEVVGIIGQLKRKALVIQNINNTRADRLKNKKLCVLVQSTQNSEKVLSLVDHLRKINPALEFFNTICRPTRIKQAEIKEMPAQNDVMIIIGSRRSANTRRLYEISRSINKNTYWVQSGKDVKKSWFENKKSVGITAGASTPDYTTKSVVSCITKLVTKKKSG